MNNDSQNNGTPSFRQSFLVAHSPEQALQQLRDFRLGPRKVTIADAPKDQGPRAFFQFLKDNGFATDTKWVDKITQVAGTLDGTDTGYMGPTTQPDDGTGYPRSTTGTRAWGELSTPGSPSPIGKANSLELNKYFPWLTDKASATANTLEAAGVRSDNNNPWQQTLEQFIPSMAQQTRAKLLAGGGLLTDTGTTEGQQRDIQAAVTGGRTSAFDNPSGLRAFLSQVQGILGNPSNGDYGKEALKTEVTGTPQAGANFVNNMLEGTVSPYVMGSKTDQNNLTARLHQQFQRSGTQQSFTEWLLSMLGAAPQAAA